MIVKPATERMEWLIDAGWNIGQRHYARHAGVQGAFMAISPDGRWCAVGDDLAGLVERAWAHQYPEPSMTTPAFPWLTWLSPRKA
ncbi:hypothetical protein [Teichococcus oryzae]|uniref:Uncharacterized protein n=1 Tax=Teichococcus oryzae TaxID=1608942 RepID=A0A5B2TFU6_9PROT|nr:hypothetical protein [Pseudoroseomonas oryzae]KAA2213039.1 hypothetical protein F0Q34_10355 [Pseudoroseomonas oryzae]